MIIQFRFKNFKSFRDEQVISMVASADKTMLTQNTSVSPALGKQRLLRSAVIYGANASGKSNVVSAFSFFRQFARNSAEKPVNVDIPVQPFQLDKASIKSPSEFELEFVDNGIRYQYGFSVDRKKVHSEWLIVYPKGLPQKWFERKSTSSSKKPDWYFGPQFKGERQRLASLTREDALFLSVAAKFNHKQLSSVYQLLWKYLRVIEADDDYHFIYTAKRVSKSNAFREKVRRLLGFADLGIVDYSIEERKTPPDNMPEPIRVMISSGDMEWTGQFAVQLRHRTGKRGTDESLLDMENESKGTRRIFSLSGPWVDALQNGYALVVDELGASLHPLLVRELIKMFHDTNANSNKAQLVFNTHDTSLLDASLFRRDQIWFVEKDNTGASHLYPLLEFSPRKDESLGKGYLKGRYGAIPLLGSIGVVTDGGAGGKK